MILIMIVEDRYTQKEKEFSDIIPNKRCDRIPVRSCQYLGVPSDKPRSHQVSLITIPDRVNVTEQNFRVRADRIMYDS